MPDDDEQLSGSELRQKYEAALAENKTLKSDATKWRATQVIQEKGFSLVKAEDLEGVALDKIDEQAQRLHEERLQLQTDLAKDLFGRQGFEGEELDQIVAEYMAGQTPQHVSAEEKAARATESVRALDRLDARPIGVQNTDSLSGLAAIEHGLAQNAKRQARR
jgi:hypothetical protein